MWMDESDVSAEKAEPAAGSKDLTRITKKELRRKRSDILTRRAKEIKPIEDRIAEIENEIDARERTLSSLNNEMQQASLAQDGEKIGEIAQSIHQCQSFIDSGFDELETLTRELDTKRAAFDQLLAEIETSTNE